MLINFPSSETDRKYISILKLWTSKFSIGNIICYQRKYWFSLFLQKRIHSKKNPSKLSHLPSILLVKWKYCLKIKTQKIHIFIWKRDTIFRNLFNKTQGNFYFDSVLSFGYQFLDWNKSFPGNTRVAKLIGGKFLRF